MKFYRKSNNHMMKLAVLLIIAMLGINILPSLSAASTTASPPTLEKYYKYSYTGTSNPYTVDNVLDGYSIEWNISDEAAGYVSFSNTDKNLRNKTVAVTSSTSNIKVYTKSNARNILGTSYIVQADVYDSSGNKLITLTDSVLVSCDAFIVQILNEPAGRTMYAGASYDFNRMIFPRNSANKTFWLVTDASGNVVADTKNDIVTNKASMSSAGVFTPNVVDSYTIKALVYRSKDATVLRAESEPVTISVIPAPEVTPTPVPVIPPTTGAVMPDYHPIFDVTPTPVPTSVPTPLPTSTPTPEPTSIPELETITLGVNDFVEDIPNIVDTDSISIGGSATANTSVSEVKAEYHSDITTTVQTLAAVGTDPFTISPLPLDMGNNYITVSASAVSGTSISYSFVVSRIANVNSSFTGTVFESDYDRDADNNPFLPNAQVKLTNLHPAPSNLAAYFATFTDSNGAFSFSSIPVGTYVLEVVKDGYIAFRDAAYTITASGNTRIIYLDEANQTSALSGIVTVADEDTNSGNNSVLPGITVTLNKLGSNTMPTVTAVTDSNGKYTFGNLPLGIYELTIVDSNYIPITSEIILYTANTTVYNITLESISKTFLGTGTATGTIYNALTGNGADAGLTLIVLKGYNLSSGEIVTSSTTGANGAYSLTLDAGNYTVYVMDERAAATTRFNDGFFNIKVMGNRTISNQNGQVTPVLANGEIRTVLVWGSTPYDLDSHLSGPATGSGTFHVYYGDQSYSSNGVIIVELDVDDTSSYGPETTTIYKQTNGVYKFSVHDFTNRGSSSSTALANSGANVKVYIGDTVVTFFVPNVAGTVWDVFEFNSVTGQLTTLNVMYYEREPEDIGF